MVCNRLKAKLVLEGKSVNEMCGMLGISRSAWHRKMNGISDFTRSEISQISQYLYLDEAEMMSIFLLMLFHLRNRKFEEIKMYHRNSFICETEGG